MNLSGAGGTPPHMPSISARRALTVSGASTARALPRMSAMELAATALLNLPAASPARGV